MLHDRGQRWPSAWETELVFKYSGRMLAEIRNVSATGMLCSTASPVKKGEPVRLRLSDMRIEGLVMRSTSSSAAIEFQRALRPHELAMLRQFRRLNSRRLG